MENNRDAALLRIGYSEKINDPAFKKYVKNNNRWSAIFALILALAAIVGFFIYGETSQEMYNPQALYIGFGIGSMFIIIAFIQIIFRKRSKTWDGVIVDKTIEDKYKKQSTGGGNNDYYIKYYKEYSVIVKEDKKKRTHSLICEDDDTVYNYYEIGDKVRHHGELNSYEKYNKSNDRIIFCNACSTLCLIEEDFCWRCNSPLLK